MTAKTNYMTRWSLKDILLVAGILVAAIIVTAAVLFKDDISFSLQTKSITPKKLAYSEFTIIQKVKSNLSK